MSIEQSILAALAGQEMTLTQLSAASGASRDAVSMWLRRLEARGEVRIVRQQAGQGGLANVWGRREA